MRWDLLHTMDLNPFAAPGHSATVSQSITSFTPAISTSMPTDEPQLLRSMNPFYMRGGIPPPPQQLQQQQQQKPSSWDFSTPDPASPTASFALSDNRFSQISATLGLANPPPPLPPPPLPSPPAPPQAPPEQNLYAPRRSRQILPTRVPRARDKDGHDNKRSKVAPDTTPFDSINYWLQFDDQHQDSMAPVQRDDRGGASTPATSREKGGAPSTHESMSTAQAQPGPATKMRSPRATVLQDYVDDSALDNGLSDKEGGFSSINLADQLSTMDSAPPTEVPPREGLYSTPLSWEKPQPGLHPNAFADATNTMMMNEAEQRRLLAIALNPGSTMGTMGPTVNPKLFDMFGSFTPSLGRQDLGRLDLGGDSGGQQQDMGLVKTTEIESLMNQAAETAGGGGGDGGGGGGCGDLGPNSSQQRGGPSLRVRPPIKRANPSEKAKAAAAATAAARVKDDDDDNNNNNDNKNNNNNNRKDSKHLLKMPIERAAHNDIERKYRTNLKDRIAELQDAVPALRTISEGGEDEDMSQPNRHAKVSKGVVFAKATEYIQYLEKKNKEIVQQHRELSRRLQAFEQLLHATARSTAYQIPQHSQTLFDPRGFC